MSNKISVLVFPCGAENAIEIHASLKDVVNIKLFGASGKEDHGRFIFKNYISNAPYIKDANFIDHFNSILSKYNIDVIIPTHDDISLFFAQNIEKINAKIGVPGLKQAQICRSKKRTYELFKDEAFCPMVFETYSSIKQFPVFVKPDKGQGGKGAFKLEEYDKNSFENKLAEDYVISEYLSGEELTVDCFTDRYNKLRFIGPRQRNRVFGGISVNSFTVSLSKEIEIIAEVINEKLKMRGLWYFQLKKDISDKFKLLEISIRTAGTMNLYRGLGVNFPLLTVYDLMDFDIEILKNEYYLEVDRALFNRYKSSLDYETIYIDFDDTITKDGKVNPYVMLFLYNVRNNHKKIKLLTKHTFDLNQTFAKLAIQPLLFDEIILLGPDEEKFKKITESKNVIFIDNSFNERAKVRKELNIPVFDVDAINTLIDWRE